MMGDQVERRVRVAAAVVEQLLPNSRSRLTPGWRHVHQRESQLVMDVGMQLQESREEECYLMALGPRHDGRRVSSEKMVWNREESQKAEHPQEQEKQEKKHST